MAEKRETERARLQRRNASGAERRLWRFLRSYQLAGLKFRRQYPVGGYVADFACVSARLIVEVDGGSHGLDEQQTYDYWRTENLGAHGWTVIRFTNREVMEDLPRVLAAVEHAAMPPLPRERAAPRTGARSA